MATPAEKRSDETPQELATRRLSAESAESVHWGRRIPSASAYKKMSKYSFVCKLRGPEMVLFFLVIVLLKKQR
ncbi:hypothetical protein BCM40_13630 [Planococcus donghaensis]|uniref:Uncharacterized protein n=1 Tax=Planococcus donghaensis TaxID=414778 RepID=A0A1C7EKB4_9BACL|nr:hypothetical protein BCM40_13630 [Planococcus donghaensis]